MKLSVVIPNYNNEAYLRKSIESAIHILPTGDGEIIFVDDCSTDDSYKVAQEYKSDIRIYRNEKNIGQARTTNKGLELAQGEYSVILHSDDVLHNNFYKVLSGLLEHHPSAVMAVGERKEINSDGEVIYIPPPFYDGDYLIPGLEQAKIFLLSGFLPCQVLFRRDVVLSFGGAQRFFDVNLDGLLWFKTSLNGDVIYTQKTVCSYRKHDFSTTSSLNKSLMHPFEYYCTIKEMFNYAEENGVDLSENYSKAFDRISELTVRFAKEIYADKDIKLCKRYLMLAESIDPSIRDNQMFTDLENMIKKGELLDSGISVRTGSYSPPSGSKKLTGIRR